jgi:fibronectin type 3 domain-containing protein
MSTSYTDSTVTAGTSYTYTIKAVDTAGTLSTATALTVSAPANSTSGTFDVYNPTP